mgnify:CR=1 FL=1
MALSKSITNNKGITTTYHRVYSVTNGEEVIVRIYSYIDKSYRDRELLQKVIDRYTNSAIDENGEYVDLTDEQKEELDYAFENVIHNAQVEERLEVVDADDLSFEGIYNSLKSLDVFSNAEDV